MAILVRHSKSVVVVVVVVVVGGGGSVARLQRLFVAAQAGSPRQRQIEGQDATCKHRRSQRDPIPGRPLDCN